MRHRDIAAKSEPFRHDSGIASRLRIRVLDAEIVMDSVGEEVIRLLFPLYYE